MQIVLGFLKDLGWGITIGTLVLLIGAPIVLLQHWGETKEAKAKREAGTASKNSSVGSERSAP
jgi:hypothetical protein